MIQPAMPRATEAGVSPRQRHPRGLYVLFFTEMWERFSYYGMRALLVLFMVDAVRGGLGMTDRVATSIYGLYTAAVYLAALPGGWIADRFLGAQKSVWYGGIVIACGHFTLAIHRTDTFYLGLMLVVVGTGLLKPNVSATVGELYPEGGARRDAGFSIFYMGINLGALLGPLVCSALGERVNWHYGFAAAGVGMVLGLAQYRFSAHHLGEAGRKPGHAEGVRRKDWLVLCGLALTIIVVAGLALSGSLRINPVALAALAQYIIVGVGAVYFVVLFLFFNLDAAEKKRVVLIIILLLTSAMFWAGQEQAGSSLNLFAERYTRRVFFGATIPTGWFQSVGPLFVISLAPVAGFVWLALARRNADLSLPAKFAWGLLLLAAGFLVMAAAAAFVAAGQKVWPTWLITTYFLHTVGELCLSPVGLSSVTKLAPRRLVGQLMGTWFLATSLGNLIAGLVAGSFSADAVQQMPRIYLQMVIIIAGTGVALLICVRPLRKLMGGIN